MTLDPIRPYLSAIKAGAIVLAFALVWWHGFDTGRDRWHGKFDTEAAAHKADNAAHAAVLADLADKTRVAETAAKLASDVAKAERRANNKRFEEAKDEAATARKALADALRAGRVRLREEWTCPASRSAEGAAGYAAGGQDADAQLRRAREGAVLDAIGDADAADRWIGWLQSELISTRTACGVTP